jgi:hypothetical protein
VALVGWNVAEQAPDAGFAVVELAADLAARENDWGAAAAALQEFVTRVPSHLAALCRLVEICVDGSLEATLYSAQAQLADAYITAGMATEARFISEDLVAREPWDRSNIERFRKTLVMTNEPDPDALIAERLSGQSPFTSTDLSADFFPPFEPPAPPPAPAAGPAEPGRGRPRSNRSTPRQTFHGSQRADGRHWEYAQRTGCCAIKGARRDGKPRSRSQHRPQREIERWPREVERRPGGRRHAGEDR